MRVVFVLARTYEEARTWWRRNASAEAQPHFRFASDGHQFLGRSGGVDLIVLPLAEQHPRFGEVLSVARTKGLKIIWALNAEVGE